MKHVLTTLMLLLVLAAAAFAEGQVPTRYGAGLTLGQAYDPSADLTWVQGYGVALFDYDSVWPHAAPEPLRFKVEASVGATVRPSLRAIASVNVLATYYLTALERGPWRPYVEAGIGAIYSDFKVDGQGLRFNFNPQAGIGTEYTCPSGIDWFLGLRASHVSNGGLDDDNRGINAVTLTLGRFF